MAAHIQQENISRLNDEEDPTRIDRRGGPRLLLVALIKNAVNTLEEWSRRYDKAYSRQYEFRGLQQNALGAYEYLMSDRRDGVTSFLRACDETNADPQAVRDLIAARVSPRALAQLRAMSAAAAEAVEEQEDAALVAPGSSGQT
jgi:hypothetical protein